MRLAPSHYPEQLDVYCFSCDEDFVDVDVDSIEADDVYWICPGCGEGSYERVIFDD